VTLGIYACGKRYKKTPALAAAVKKFWDALNLSFALAARGASNGICISGNSV
jgi:hypothetical protein